MPDRRAFLAMLSGGLASLGIPASAPAKHGRTGRDDLTWYDVADWGVEGKGWTATEHYYDRLPARAKSLVREPVWGLSQDSAGMAARFTTESPSISVRYTLRKEGLGMVHMPATGVSGIDLYAEDGYGKSRWAGVTLPQDRHVEAVVAEGLAPGSRHYTVYLPLYNGVESLEIGVEAGTKFEAIRPRIDRPMLFYGTSIMQGACASRPGLAIPAILGRRLGLPTINLGFSGNGQMEPEVADLLAELDPAVYAVDCLPNMNDRMIDERAANLVRRLREAHDDTPILLVEDRSFTNAAFFPALSEHHRASRRSLRNVFRILTDEGVDQLYYLQGEDLLGLDGEGATDASHPNDLGMVRYADAYEPALRTALGLFG